MPLASSRRLRNECEFSSRSNQVVVSINGTRAFAISFVATYVASFVFFVLIPTSLSPRVSVAAAIALILIASVGVIIGLLGGRGVLRHHSGGAVLAALLVALTALFLKRALDNPVREPPSFLAFAERHVGLGLMLVVTIMLASLLGFWLGQARSRH
jgi:hypothetical protein